jgi:hypothetical protein
MEDERVSIPQPRNLKERALEGFKRFVAIFLYLWVVFGLLSIHKNLVLSQRHLDYEEHTFAIIDALVFAKVLLLGEELHLGRRFENKPLIYPILYKCLVFSIVLICFHAVETVAVGVWHGNTIIDSVPPLLGLEPEGTSGCWLHLRCPTATVLRIQRDCKSDGPHGDADSAFWKNTNVNILLRSPMSQLAIAGQPTVVKSA